jgi:hypothetical protein
MVFIAAFSSQPVCLADRLGRLASAHRATGVKFYRKWPFVSIIWPVPPPADRPASLSQAQQEQQMSLAYQSFSDPRAASRFLAEREEPRLLGDGTLLVRRVNEGDVSIGTYVRLLTPELQQIQIGDDVTA